MTAPLWWAISISWPVGSDLIFYATSLKLFSQQFWQGNVAPRWLMDANAALGSPVFVYYPPLTFYLGSLFQGLSQYDPTGMGRVLLTMQAAIIASGLSCYRWLKLSLPFAQAMQGALLYAAFPSVALLMYFDFGVTQLCGLMWFPLLLAEAKLLARGDHKMPLRLSILYALLALTHLPSTLIFGGVPVLYGYYLAAPGKKLETAATVLLAGLFGAALAAFWLLPTAMNEAFIMTKFYLQGNGDYALNFFKVRTLMAAGIIVLLLAGIFLETKKPRRQIIEGEQYFWLAILGLFGFLASYLSAPLWALLPPLRYLQFPWRMFIGAIPAALFLAISWLPHAKNKRFTVIFVILVFSLNGYVSASALFFPSPAPLKDSWKENLIASREYQTQWMARDDIFTYLTMRPDVKNRSIASFVNGVGTVHVAEWQPDKIMLFASVYSESATLQLRRFYFPGWKVLEPAELTYLPVAEHESLLALPLKKGNFRLVLSFMPKGESLGSLISYAALALWLGLWLRLRCKAIERPADIG